MMVSLIRYDVLGNDMFQLKTSVHKMTERYESIIICSLCQFVKYCIFFLFLCARIF